MAAGLGEAYALGIRKQGNNKAPRFEGVRSALLGLVALALLLSVQAARAAESERDDAPGSQGAKAPEGPSFWRFEFDNDNFVGNDDAFTAGFGLEYNSATLERWDEGPLGALAGLSRGVDYLVPGVSLEGTRRGRITLGFTQMMQTPREIRLEEPQNEDVPWSGALLGHVTWATFDSRRHAAFQVSLGCVGPCSLAEDAQKFVHNDLDLGPTPGGWDNQLVDEFAWNLNYGLRFKLAEDPGLGYGRPELAWDLAAGGSVAVGSLFNLVDALIEARAGWRMPRGFALVADPPGRGVATSTSFIAGQGERGDGLPPAWSFWGSAVLRVGYLERVRLLEGGETVAGGRHPGLDYERAPIQVVLGLHAERGRFGVHVTYFNYLFDNRVLGKSVPSSLEWVNLALEYRF